MPKRLEFTEWQKFWEWTVLWEIKHNGITRMVRCKCGCWVEKRVNVSSLSQWRSKSCWCNIRTHNQSWKKRTKLYVTYTNIKQRCENPKHKSYKDYWARWIKCLRRTFNDFFRDMWESYYDHVSKYWEYETTIDRVNSKGDYCRENCRWATHLEQSNNLSSNRKVVYKWKEYPTLSSLCREYWIWITTLNMRINKYWLTIEEAIELPLQDRKCWFKKLRE